MLKLLGLLPVIWLGTVYSFVSVMHAKERLNSGGLTLFWKVHMLPLAVLGLLLDFSFNVTFGTLLFKEWPRELLFSSRVQRHYLAEGSRGRMAGFWARQLNQMDPEHIHEPRE